MEHLVVKKSLYHLHVLSISLLTKKTKKKILKSPVWCCDNTTSLGVAEKKRFCVNRQRRRREARKESK